MEPSDVTIEVLKGIREEIHTGLADVRTELRQGLAGVRTEVAELRTEVAELRGEVKEVQRRQTETEMRLATELVAVTSAVLQVRDLLREDRLGRSQVQDHERRIAALEKKVG